ncbi:MAG: prepilin-type N-terminal cleavage/methylation domain-containing protein [Candidatus Brocadiia bacterium]
MRTEKGFTLMELMIVISIIAIIASVAIPNVMSSRRVANESASLAAIRSFGTAAMMYQNSNASQYFWPDKAEMEKTFNHHDVKSGYWFIYQSDSDVKPTRFVYFAFPASVTTGHKAYYIDEEQAIWQADDLTDAQISALKALDPIVGDWSFVPRIQAVLFTRQ